MLNFHPEAWDIPINQKHTLPALLVRGKAKSLLPFIEYEEIGTNKALLFPATPEGGVNYFLLSNKARRLWWDVQQQPERWQETVLVTLRVPPQPAIVICECRNLIHIPLEKSFDATCQCGAYYTVESAHNLPRATKE